MLACAGDEGDGMNATELPNPGKSRRWSIDRATIEPDAGLVDQTQVPISHIHRKILPEDKHKSRAGLRTASWPYHTPI